MMGIEDRTAVPSLQDLLDSLADDGFVLTMGDDGLGLRSATGRPLDETRARLLREREDELSRHLRVEAAKRRLLAPIPRADRSGRLPLSLAQQRLWFVETFAGSGTGAYHVPTVVGLSGWLDLGALARALDRLVARHEILRSVFDEEHGRPFQRVLPHAPLALDPVEVAPADLDDAIRAEAVRPFDLAAPPLRVTLFRLAADEHRLLLVQHHIISDGWSIDLLVREFAALYNDFAGGSEPSPPGPALQYGDFAVWQRDWLDEDLIRSQLGFWRQALLDYTPLELPTDRPRRTATPSYHGRHHHFRLESEVAHGLDALARAENTTLFTVLLAAFNVLLRIHSGQDDVTIATAVAGRPHLDLNRVPGFFVNLVPLRTRFTGDLSFRYLLDQVSTGVHEALSYQDVPYERLIADLRIPREAGRTPLERVVFLLQTANAGPPPTMSGLRVGVAPEVDYDVAKFELTFSLLAAGGTIEGRIEYSTELYDESTIQRLAAHYMRLLAAAARDPAAPLAASALLTADEFRRFVLESNRTSTAYPRDASLVTLFERQVDRAPGAIAVRDHGRAVTYGELDRRANTLAQRLLGLGVGSHPEPIVALYAERSIELVAAMLGILKAGAAYLPVDPRYPEARVRYMLEQTRAAAIVANDGSLAASFAGLPMVVLDEPAVATDVPESRPELSIAATDLAYVCFTSGTTGAPKGVLVDQRAVVRLVVETSYIAIGSGQRVALASNAVFDAVTFEIWGALLNGATLVVVDRDTLLDTEALADQLERDRIDVLWLTAALFDQHARSRPAMFRHLSHLLVGGSALNPATVRAVITCPEGSPRHFLNGYGPTENTTFSTVHPVVSLAPDQRSIPIGRPIANSTAYVLDQSGAPLPPGVRGELHVGGDGLAQGYLADPEGTASRFVQHAFSHPAVGERIVARLYRTGDLARWGDDGTIDYLGRADRQLKLHGYRVEPGEIEAAIAAVPAILHCAVQPIERDGRRQLCAWYACHDGAVLTEFELRRHLDRILPAYMVPAHLVHRPRLPTNSSGKLDLGSLALPEASASPATGLTTGGDVAARLRAIWCEVLRTERVGLSDDFFGSGGDSILSIQVVARAREFGLRITPRDIFEARTIERLSARVAIAREETAELVVLPGGAVPLTPVQRWFFSLRLPDRHHFNQAFLLLPARPVDPSRLRVALGRLIERHDALRLRFSRAADGTWQQAYATPEGAPAVLTYRLEAAGAGSQGEALQHRLTEWQGGLDLAGGPLLSVGLIEGHRDGRQRLLLAVHHLAIDIVSWRVLLDDLGRLLDDTSRELPPATASFGAWSAALVRFAGAAESQASLAYWKMAIARPAMPLPCGESGADTGPDDVQVRLDAGTTAALLREASRTYNTRPHELILAALVAVAGRWLGGRSISLTLEGHGREDVVGLDVSRTIGWFTSRFPVRFELPSAPDSIDPGSLIVAVKEQLRAVPHNGLSYGVLRDLSPDAAVRAALSATPEPELSFNYLGQFDGLAGESWTIAPEPPGAMTGSRNPAPARLDVSVLIAEGQLEARFAAGRPALPAQAVERLAAAFITELRKLVTHCRSRTTICYTRSDFPQAGLASGELERALAGGVSPPAAAYRLSPLQEGLLFHALHSPASDQYVVQFEWHCRAEIDPHLLERAWKELVEAHDVLRTRFAWRGLPHPVQVVEMEAELAWRVADLSTFADDAEQRLAVAAERRAERERGLDLERPCVMRVALLRLAPTGWVLLWTHHHILLDGWCVPLLLAELSRRYDALRRGTVPKVQSSPLYRDYVGWLLRQDREAALAFWREELGGFDAPTDIPVRLPATHFAANAPITELGIERHDLDRALTERLIGLARRAGVTLNSVVQIAWACLLAAYAGGRLDVVFGTIISGRSNAFPDVERLIGLAANIVPLRVRLDPAESVESALRVVHRTVEMASAHGHLSLADVQAASGLTAGVPLFHTVTVFENYPSAGAATGVLDAAPASVHDKTSFPLLLMALPSASLALTLQYDMALFAPGTIAELARHFANLLAAMAADPARPVRTIELVSPTERTWLIETCNATTVPVEPSATVASLFAAQVARTPDAIAVEDDAGRTLTYRTLDAAANRLAHLLHARHTALHGRRFAPDARVGLCLERGFGLITAILGVLKAGGAYVPLDPDYPAERLAFIVADSDCALVVTERALAARLGDDSVDRLVLVDAEAEILASQPEDPPASVPAPAHLAYLLYTSGSTGKPKGAMVEHRSLANRILWMQHAYRLDARDRVLQKTPFSFDVSVWEFIWPLLTGARLVFARPGGHKDPAYLARLIAERGITTLHFVPSALRVFLELVEADRLSSLRRIFCSGEALPADLPRHLLAALPEVEVHNLYGPTEATIDVSFHACAGRDSDAMAPIGRPVWNTQLHVLDAQMRPQPVGVPGELWIGGVQVGRGYLNRPELTSERFVPDPFGAGRLYRTGDLARRRPDGALEYLGRTDFQVKVRGVRIEPGEVESALEAVPGVRQALVLARPHRGEIELVAYLVVDAEVADDAGLRAALARRLPDSMVPARIVRLGRLPLTLSGKVDRAALPEPRDGDGQAAAGALPNGIEEAALAGIFAEVLGSGSVGADDDFFALGGHSLHAMRVVARIAERLQAEIPVVALFEQRTAARLAPVVAAARSRDAVAIPPADRTRPRPLSFAQERLWFLDRVVADRAAYNVPLALRLGGRFDPGAFAIALAEVVTRHEILRTSIAAEDGQPWQLVGSPASVPVTLESVTPERLDGHLAEIAREPFDLAHGPSIRAHLLRLGQDDHVVLLNQHHIVTDGWSLGLLTRELGERYRAALTGGDTERPPVPLQYGDFAAWERERLRSGREEQLLAFWRQRLDGAPVLNLPTDYPRPPAMGYRGGTVRFAVPAQLTSALEAVAGRCRSTLFAVLLAAFELLLARWSGQRDIVLAVPAANRGHAGQMDALGLYMNTIMLRDTVVAEDPFAALVERVATRSLAALVHQDLPFDRLVGALAVGRDPGRPPLSPVMFILQTPGELDGFAAPGLTVERLPVDTGTAKFDLTLSLEPRGGRLDGVLEYALDLFRAATIERLAAEYGRLLQAIVADPMRPTTELEAMVSGLAADVDRAPAPVSLAATPALPSTAGAPCRNGAGAAQADSRELITGIWRELLGSDGIGPDDNFFDLGGTSLTLMRVQARLASSLEREVSVMELFAHPTIARLAAWLDGVETTPAAEPPNAARRRSAHARTRARLRPLG